MMIILKTFVFGFLVTTVSAEFHDVYFWKQLDFVDPYGSNSDFIFADQVSNLPLAQRSYIAYNNVPMGVTHYKGRLFVTVPRRRPGIPATLNTIDIGKRSKIVSPKLSGYPSFDANEYIMQPQPDQLISVYRTFVDACNRLWFIDTGLLEFPGNRTQVQRPAIWVMNLETNERVRRFEFDESVVQMGNGLASITVDVTPDTCDDAFAYIPDLANNQLNVYSYRQNRMWLFHHNFFHMDPHYGDFDIGGVRYQWNDGIFSITLGRREPDGYRVAYFHPMASVSEFSVSTRVLQNETLSDRAYHDLDFKLVGQRPNGTQSTMHQFDVNSGIMFYAQVGSNSIGCWNSAKPYRKENIGLIAQDHQRMIYPSDLTIDNEGNVWVMTNTMPRFIYSSLNPNEVNFRIWRQSVSKAVQGTVCQGR